MARVEGLGAAEASFRDSFFRRFQKAAAPFIPYLLYIGGISGIFNGTEIQKSLKEKRKVTADDITLSQLQIMARVCGRLKDHKYSSKNISEFIIATILDGMDGPVARASGTDSKEGGIKDAAVDRLSEVMFARVVAEELKLTTKEKNVLEASFFLSTLTKAACEMTEVETSEGGAGGMLERRKIMLKILLNLGNPKKEEQLKNDLASLQGNSIKGAEKRIRLISQKKDKVTAPSDSKSSGASEAIKYAAILGLTEKLGINVQQILNDLAQGAVCFPSAEELERENDYIRVSLQKVQPFINDALCIAQLSKNVI